MQRELSHTIKSRCVCVWMYMVANLILLCSLKTYLSFETFKQLCKKTCAILFISSFLGGHQSTHCFQQLGHLSIFFNTLSFFMNNFCIAQCFFFAIKTFERQQQEFGAFIWWISYQEYFCVHSQCRSETFLGGFRGNGMLLRLPPVQEQCICGWCVRDLNFKSMTNLS